MKLGPNMSSITISCVPLHLVHYNKVSSLHFSVSYLLSSDSSLLSVYYPAGGQQGH